MIKINLFKCCNECNHADLKTETTKLYRGDEVEHVEYTISCNHECVCHEVKEYKEGVNNGKET